MRKFFTTAIIILFIVAPVLPQQKTAANLETYFESTANKYNIPADILKSVAYTETRFQNEIPSGPNENEMPPAYGMMGLRDDDWFGHSLIEGAKLINASPENVKTDVYLNIQAAAAVLSVYADNLGIQKNDLQSWRPVVEKYSGIPQEDIKPFFSFDVFKVLHDGTQLNGMSIQSHSQINMNQFGENVNPKNKSQIGKINAVEKTDTVYSQDYPPAVWSPSPNYYDDNNFHQLFLVVHDTEGDFASSLSWLQNPASQASAHYIIRSSDGYIVQMVREKYAAWHVRCWNRVMLGVEHEGYVNNPAYFTEAMYQASSGLFRHFVETYGVPVDSFRIIGHYQHTKPWWVSWVNNTWNPENPSYSFDPTCNTHTDPGPYWNWNHFFSLIKTGAVSPNFVSASPKNDTVWNNSSIRINFDQGMLHEQTENAFSITPNVNGTFSWENYNRTLIFTPDSLLAPSTKYTVKISNQAMSVFYLNAVSSNIFDFYTKPNSSINIENSYPANNADDISPSVNIIVHFNMPVNYSSLGGRVSLQDSAGNNLTIKNAKYFESNDEGYISFSPSIDLQYNSLYKFVLKAGLQGFNSTTLDSDQVFYFKTSKNNFQAGTIFENFSDLGDWEQPSKSGYSFGIDTSNSSLAITNLEKVGGTTSAAFAAKFINDSGTAEILNNNLPTILSSTNAGLGIWVYGDLSNNLIQLRFLVNGSSDTIIPLDTLNWTGWKFNHIPFSMFDSANGIRLRGIEIKHLSAGADSSLVLFDEIQSSDSNITGIKNQNTATNLTGFDLFQNYPNPFNPTTTIRYSIPSGLTTPNSTKAGSGLRVVLKIYNVLGQAVATLVDKDQAPGYHEVIFNAGNISNGIYFYRLSYGSYSATKKMILLK